MSQKTRAKLITDIVSNIYTNVDRLIKGNTVKDRMVNISDSTLNIISDLNVPNGYLGIDNNSRVDISFINNITPSGKFLRDDGTWSTAGGGSFVKYTGNTADLDMGAYGVSAGVLDIINGTARVKIQNLVGSTSAPAIYLNQAIPSGANYFVTQVGGGTIINDAVNKALTFQIGGSSIAQFLGARSSGASQNFIFLSPTTTGMTASTEIRGFQVTTANRQWIGGNISIQREFLFNGANYSFTSPSVISKAYGIYVESASVGANATITNNYAAGFVGNVDIQGALKLGTSSTVGHVLTAIDTVGNLALQSPTRVNVITSSATITLNLVTHNQINITALAVNTTFANPTGTPYDGQQIIYRWVDNGTSQTITLGSNFVDLVGIPAATTSTKAGMFGARWAASRSKWEIIATVTEP